MSCFSVRVHVGLLLSTVRGLKEIELECICRRYYIGYTWFAPTNGCFFLSLHAPRVREHTWRKNKTYNSYKSSSCNNFRSSPPKLWMPFDAFLPWNRRCRPEVSLGFLVVGLSAFFGEPIVDWNPITSEYLGHLVPNLPRQGDKAWSMHKYEQIEYYWVDNPWNGGSIF